MSKIIIQLQGGLVQDVFQQGEGIPIEALVVDEDTEGALPFEITTVKIGKRKTYEACVHRTDINWLPTGSDVEKIVNAFQEKE